MTEPATINYLANLASTFRPVYKRSWSEYDDEHPEALGALVKLLGMMAEKSGYLDYMIMTLARVGRASETASISWTDLQTNAHTLGNDNDTSRGHGDDSEAEPLLSLGPTQSEQHNTPQQLAHHRQRVEQLRRLELLEEAICSLNQERSTLQGALLAAYTTDDTSHVFLIARPPAYIRTSRTRTFISTFTSRQCLTTLTSLLGGPATLTLGGAFMLGMQETDTDYHQPHWLPSWFTR